MYECPVCNKKYKYWTNFIRHIISKHGFMYINERIKYPGLTVDIAGELDKALAPCGWVRVSNNSWIKEIDRIYGVHIRVELVLMEDEILLYSDIPLPPSKWSEVKEKLVSEVREIVDETVIEYVNKKLEEKAKKIKEICDGKPCQMISNNVVAVAIANSLIALVNINTEDTILLTPKSIRKLVEFMSSLK